MPFNYTKYAEKCSYMTQYELQKEHEKYVRQIAGGSTGAGIACAASGFTFGLSLVGLALSGPQIHNALTKLEIIKAQVAKDEYEITTRKRDVVGGVALSGAVGAATMGMGSAIGDAVYLGTTTATDVIVSGGVAEVERQTDKARV